MSKPMDAILVELDRGLELGQPMPTMWWRQIFAHAKKLAAKLFHRGPISTDAAKWMSMLSTGYYLINLPSGIWPAAHMRARSAWLRTGANANEFRAASNLFADMAETVLTQRGIATGQINPPVSRWGTGWEWSKHKTVASEKLERVLRTMSVAADLEYAAKAATIRRGSH